MVFILESSYQEDNQAFELKPRFSNKVFVCYANQFRKAPFQTTYLSNFFYFEMNKNYSLLQTFLNFFVLEFS